MGIKLLKGILSSLSFRTIFTAMALVYSLIFFTLILNDGEFIYWEPIEAVRWVEFLFFSGCTIWGSIEIIRYAKKTIPQHKTRKA